MKFGQEFEAQKVPEWSTRYCNYKELDAWIKSIKKEKAAGGLNPSIKRTVTFHRIMSVLASPRIELKRMASIAVRTQPPSPTMLEEEEGIMAVHLSEEAKQRQYSEKAVYLMGELGKELNKTSRFYAEKEEEFIARARELDRQMETLFAEKEGSSRGNGSSHKGNQSSHDNEGHMATVQEEDEVEIGNTVKVKVESMVDGRPALVIPPVDPASLFLSAAANVAQSSLQLLRVRKLEKAEVILRKAFLDFYHGLCLLRNFGTLNVIAFSKILKKFDKATGDNLSSMYMKIIEDSHINRIDKVQKMMDRVESIFEKHFSDANRKKAKKHLRPINGRAKHSVTFLLGLFCGGTLSILVSLIILIRIQDLPDNYATPNYMKSVFPLYSMMFATMLHIALFGFDVYFWGRTRINYTFMLECKRGTRLHFHSYLLIASGLATFSLGGMLLHLTVSLETQSLVGESIPLILVLVAIIALFLPFKLLYYSTRRYFLRTLFHCICAPFYKVLIADFFLADNITSQVPTLRNFEYFICYYAGGHFKTRNSLACTGSQSFRSIAYVISLLPYWWRFIQSMRRWYEEKDVMQLYNALKFAIVIVAVACRVRLSTTNSMVWMVLTIIFSALATLASTYWDLVIDWGLLRRHSSNPWLRDQLVLKNKAIYFIAMVMDVILRFVWLQTVLNFNLNLNKKAVELISASLEIFRRAVWNFFRLENEHLNNVGKFRAVKTIPLPFADE